MLTDIFKNRYPGAPKWEKFEEADRRFIVQAFRVVTEQLYKPYINGKTNEAAHEKLKLIHDRLATELGVLELSKRYYSYQTTFNGKPYTQSGSYSWDYVCKHYVCKDFEDGFDPDVFIKNRLSFIEIAFREREEDLKTEERELPAKIIAAKQFPRSGLRVPSTGSGDRRTWVEIAHQQRKMEFRADVDELNTRMRQAGYDLNYHNGFIQVSSDSVVEREIETPFWALVVDAKWANVDTDMKEAMDARDSGGRDPAWWAAKALESTIKIISDEKGWTHGKENGPHNFIENLSSRKNEQFIHAWERDSLKQFFTDVRRPFGHGAGSDQMPKLSPQQTNWAIQFCMAWVKSLIERM